MTTLSRPLTLVLAGVALVSLGLWWGRSRGKDALRLEQAEARAAQLADAYRAERLAHRRTAATTDSLRTAVGRADEGVSVAGQVLTPRLDANAVLLANANATNAELRAALQRTTEAATWYMAQVNQLRDSTSALILAQLAERAASERALQLADSTIAAKDAVIRALDCRVLGLRCPTRVQSAVGGMGVVVLLVLLL